MEWILLRKHQNQDLRALSFVQLPLGNAIRIELTHFWDSAKLFEQQNRHAMVRP
jgi:hypothetical protein